MRQLQFYGANRVQLLAGGAEFHPALLAAINAAEQEIYLETYIFAGDEVGNAVQQALQAAARRGVHVKIISDWHGTGRSRIKLLERALHIDGVEHRSYNPWFWHGVSRSHRKLCLIDNRIAFVGGMNLNDDWYCDFNPGFKLEAPRWDFTVRLEGPLVQLIVLDMQMQWQRLGRITLRQRMELAQQIRQHRAESGNVAALVSFVVRDNWRNRRTIQRAYLQAIGTAHHSVLLATPYFAPGRKFKTALAAAAERGVKVTLLLGVGQFKLQDAVARAFYPRLLKSGVQLYEYNHTQLHGKIAVVDDQWATVGSSNCDGLSLFLNQEANLVVKDAEFAQQLRQQFETALAQSTPITPADFVMVPWYKRAGYELAFWVYQGLMRVVTWGEYT